MLQEYRRDLVAEPYCSIRILEISRVSRWLKLISELTNSTYCTYGRYLRKNYCCNVIVATSHTTHQR